MLPDLAGGSFLFDWCRFDVSSEGTIVAGPRCPGRAIEVRKVGAVGGSSDRFRGCAPAWKPNGQLTFVRDGDVVDEEKVLIEDVGRLAENALGRGSCLRSEVQQLAWLSDERVAVVVAARNVVPAVMVVVEDGRVVSEPIFVEGDAAIEVSADREELFVGDGFVQVFNRHGASVSDSRFGFSDIAAVAESPDRRFVALARPDNVCIYEETEPPPREQFLVACLPFDAVDLAWL